MVRILVNSITPSASNTFTITTISENVSIAGTTITHPATDYNVLNLLSQYEALFSEEIQTLADQGKIDVKINGHKANNFHPFRVSDLSVKDIADDEYSMPNPSTNSVWESVTLNASYADAKTVINAMNTHATNDIVMWVRAEWSTKGNKKFTVAAWGAKSFNVKVDSSAKVEVYTEDKDNSGFCLTAILCNQWS